MPTDAYPNGSSAYPKPVRSRRRLFLIFSLIAVFLCFVIFFSTSSVTDISQTARHAKEHIRHPSIPALPDIRNPFRQAVHEPPEQRNSTSGEDKWYSDWKWLNPFSSSITLDEHRIVLPNVQLRPPIYTFYDSESEKTEDVRAAEKNLLLIWRRAWWAQGFWPVILGRAEAMKNPNYEIMQSKKISKALETELIRWLAWGYMGSGILANWLLLPMGSHDDHLLSYLRRGRYERLTRYEELGTGLYSGQRTSIDAAISTVLKSRELSSSKTVLEAASDPDLFAVDPKPNDVAFYDPVSLTNLYKPVADALLTNQAQGLSYLSTLISAHLHANFLNIFASGLSVLTPHGGYSAALYTSALSLATALNTCADSPVPHSCPPNAPKCRPCSPVHITTPAAQSNDSSIFTIGTVPHPYTLALLLARKPDINVRHVRRDTERDRWLQVVTQETLGKKVGGTTRIVSFKEGVASDAGAARGIWTAAEETLKWRDMEWHFGFELPRTNMADEDVVLSATEKQMKPLRDSLRTQAPSVEALKVQEGLLAAAREVVIHGGKKKGEGPDMKAVVEAWNLADTEAWRFVKAFEARGLMERRAWEEDEREFVNVQGRDDGWARWFDRS